MALLQQIEEVFQLIVQYDVLLLECAGVTILLVTAVQSMLGCIRRNPRVRLSWPRALLWRWNSSWGEMFSEQ